MARQVILELIKLIWSQYCHCACLICFTYYWDHFQGHVNKMDLLLHSPLPPPSKVLQAGLSKALFLSLLPPLAALCWFPLLLCPKCLSLSTCSLHLNLLKWHSSKKTEPWLFLYFLSLASVSVLPSQPNYLNQLSTPALPLPHLPLSRYCQTLYHILSLFIY